MGTPDNTPLPGASLLQPLDELTTSAGADQVRWQTLRSIATGKLIELEYENVTQHIESTSCWKTLFIAEVQSQNISQNGPKIDFEI